MRRPWRIRVRTQALHHVSFKPPIWTKHEGNSVMSSKPRCTRGVDSGSTIEEAPRLGYSSIRKSSCQDTGKVWMPQSFPLAMLCVNSSTALGCIIGSFSWKLGFSNLQVWVSSVLESSILGPQVFYKGFQEEVRLISVEEATTVMTTEEFAQHSPLPLQGKTTLPLFANWGGC